MFNVLVRFALFAFVILPCVAAAEPIELKLALFSSDRSMTYLAAVKPFVDAVIRKARASFKLSFMPGAYSEKKSLSNPKPSLMGRLTLLS
jgi:hypothetical protein